MGMSYEELDNSAAFKNLPARMEAEAKKPKKKAGNISKKPKPISQD